MADNSSHLPHQLELLQNKIIFILRNKDSNNNYSDFGSTILYGTHNVITTETIFVRGKTRWPCFLLRCPLFFLKNRIEYYYYYHPFRVERTYYCNYNIFLTIYIIIIYYYTRYGRHEKEFHSERIMCGRGVTLTSIT